MDLKGKVAVVTGGAQGIGKGIVKRYIEEKAKVAIFDCDEKVMAETKAEMEALGGEVMTFSVDVKSKAAVQNAVDLVAKTWGTIDLLAACAGICCAGFFSFRTFRRRLGSCFRCKSERYVPGFSERG